MQNLTVHSASPHPDRRLRPPAAHSPSRIPTEHHRHPPLSGELLPELPIPAFSCNFLTPLPLQCCRTPHPPSPPTGAPSPPMNATAQHRLHRLTVDPPFRCAPALSSLPGTFPVTPLKSPATPYRCRAAGEHTTTSSHTWSARGDRASARTARARCSRPRRPVAPVGWAARPWPSRCFGRPRVAGRRALWALASGRFRPGTVPGILNIFSIILNSRN
jgi:hypothetical protein